MTFREWVNGPYTSTLGETIHPEARAAAILGVSRQSIRNWLAGCSPARTKWALLSVRTGNLVPPEAFAPKEVSR